MGQRANLVVVENGDWKLFYDHWCANRLDIELFWGPTLAKQYIEQRPHIEDRDEWLDEVWGEGSVVVDYDRRVVLWFGGVDILYDIPQRRVFLELMQYQWPDWEIRWANGSVADIGAYVGVGAEIFYSIEEPEPDNAIRILTEYPEDNCMLLTVRRNSTTGAAQVLGCYESLELGADFLKSILEIPTSSSLAWEGDMPTAGLHIDIDKKAIEYWLARPVAAIEKRIQRKWPGWNTRWLKDNYEEHLLTADVDIKLPSLDQRQIRVDIIDYLQTNACHAVSNPVRELAPRIVWARIPIWKKVLIWMKLTKPEDIQINPCTDEARGSVGKKVDKLKILDELKRTSFINE